jgi:hypothetical protein
MPMTVSHVTTTQDDELLTENAMGICYPLTGGLLVLSLSLHCTRFSERRVLPLADLRLSKTLS